MGRPYKKKNKASGQKKVRAGTVDKVRKLVEEIRALEEETSGHADLLARFRDRDLPEFDKWADEHVGTERKKLAETLEEIEFHEAVLQQAEIAHAFGHFRHYPEAVAAVHEELKAAWQAEKLNDTDDETTGSPFEDLPGELADVLLESFMAEVRGIDVDEMEPEAYEKIRADFAETFRHAADGNHAAFEKAILRIGADDSKDNLSAVKAAFRRLAKRLHPDHHGDFDEAEKTLWNEAMASYQALDPTGLEVIDARLSLLRGEEIMPAQVPALRIYRGELSARLDRMLDDIDAAEVHPAWEFSLKKKTRALLDSMRRAMLADFQDAIEQLRDLKEVVQVSLLKSRPKAKKPSRRSVDFPHPSSDGKPAVKRKRAPKGPRRGDSQVEFPF